MKWFWKTLFGYTVTFVGVDKEWIVTHRPFRQPITTSRHGGSSNGFAGKSFTAIYFDEWVKADEVSDLIGESK